MRCFTFLIFALIMSVSFNAVHAEEGGVIKNLTIKTIVKKAKEASSTDQRSDAITAAADIRNKEHRGKCSLVIVTGQADAWDKDLYVKSVSDLGAGILTQTQVLVDNANMAVLVTGMNPQLQLMESNALWWDESLTPVSEGLDAFKTAAKAAGYTVENLGDIACQSSSRFASRRAKVLKARELRQQAAEATAAAKALEAGAEAETEEPQAEEPQAEEPKAEPKAEGKSSPA